MDLTSATAVGFVASTDLERSREFFGGTLGLPVEGVDGFACVVRVGETTLRVTKVDDLRPQPFTVFGWAVTDLDATVGWLAGRGVTFLRFDGMGQSEQGVWTAPGGARIAWFHDPDGNTLSLTEFV
jgi:catechol 2,3-dioxygenase-like lactoylglutathione lyase family enzyme